MRAKPFDASQFVPTQWNSAADKAAFGNTYLHFIESEWKRSLFTKSFYERLSNCFGHIANYNIDGFYQTWFTCDKDLLRFLRNTLSWPCWGDQLEYARGSCLSDRDPTELRQRTRAGRCSNLRTS